MILDRSASKKRKYHEIFDTDGKFATGINNTSGTGGKICRTCR
jgi:hypothetical protein